ncbi:MAG: ribonuclease HI [Bacteroidia bacterium]|nr:ribonuclease HI [Bacteroidia bacterium]
MFYNSEFIFVIYTDGSSNPQLKTGAWAAIILQDQNKISLSGLEINTTHNRMELTAGIKALEYLQSHYKKINLIQIYTDSQYMVGLTSRKDKVISANFTTKKGVPVRNEDLVKTLLNQIETMPVKFIKVRAHQKKTEIINYNTEVDKLARKLVRDKIKKDLFR